MFKNKSRKAREKAEKIRLNACLKELEAGRIGGFPGRWMSLSKSRRELYVYLFYVVALALVCAATYAVKEPGVGVASFAAMFFGGMLFISFLSMEARSPNDYRDLLSRLIAEGTYAEITRAKARRAEEKEADEKEDSKNEIV